MLFDFIFDYLGYYWNYIMHYMFSCLDLLWYPFAIAFNAGIGLFAAIFNIGLTLFSWSNVTFSYFVVSMIIIFMFGIVVKIILWLKEIILRWI